MSNMNANRLHVLADRIQAVLEEFDIDAELFNLKIRVSKEYYQSIKENFPDRHPIDMIVGTGERDWAIELMYSAIQEQK